MCKYRVIMPTTTILAVAPSQELQDHRGVVQALSHERVKMFSVVVGQVRLLARGRAGPRPSLRRRPAMSAN